MIPADMAELADALDLGSSVFDVQVQVLLSAPKPQQGCCGLNSGELAQLGERVVRNHEVRGSIPLFSTISEQVSLVPIFLFAAKTGR